jgi:hypothetical protein
MENAQKVHVDTMAYTAGRFQDALDDGWTFVSRLKPIAVGTNTGDFAIFIKKSSADSESL